MNELEMLIEEFKNSDSADEKESAAYRARGLLRGEQIAVYGAGAVGKAIAYTFGQLAIPIDFFVDRKWAEIGMIGDTKVLAPDSLKALKGRNALIIVSIDPILFLEFKEEILKNIRLYCPDSRVIAYGRDLLLLLRYLECGKKLLEGYNFNIAECINCGAESRGCDIFDKYLRKIAPGSTLNKNVCALKYNKFFGYILGNICTLKCEHCCEMVPYYNNRGFVSKYRVIEDCKRVADATGFTMYVELIGGEPFLHPDIVDILCELLKLADVGYIKVFTNGTVPPDIKLCEVLKQPRLVLLLSNYQDTVKGALTENIIRTKDILEKEGIDYIYSMSKTWLDFSSFDFVEKSAEQLENDFEECHIANCHRLYEGVLYRCPHQYAAARLKKIPIEDGEYVNIGRAGTREELSKLLFEFKQLKYVDACRYCALPHNAEEVPAGEQLEEKHEAGKSK